MATTTNFGWETPDDTDLVKDGAAAMRTLGNSIDTSFVDLKGGTTGQVLAKASNTDLDYTWTTPQVGDITEVAAGIGISGGGTSGAVTITNSMATAIDAKGDLIAGTGADTFSRLAVGTNGQVLTAASGQTTGLEWTTISANSQTVITSGSFSGTTNLSLSSFSGYKDLRLIITGAYTASSANYFNLTVNGLGSGIWNSAFTNSSSSTVTNNENIGNISLVEDTTTGSNAANTSIVDIFNYTESSNAKVGRITAITYSNSNSKWVMRTTGFGVRVTAAITSMNIQAASGMQGSYQLIGIK